MPDFSCRPAVGRLAAGILTASAVLEDCSGEFYDFVDEDDGIVMSVTSDGVTALIDIFDIDDPDFGFLLVADDEKD